VPAAGTAQTSVGTALAEEVTADEVAVVADEHSTMTAGTAQTSAATDTGSCIKTRAQQLSHSRHYLIII